MDGGWGGFGGGWGGLEVGAARWWVGVGGGWAGVGRRVGVEGECGWMVDGWMVDGGRDGVGGVEDGRGWMGDWGWGCGAGVGWVGG